MRRVIVYWAAATILIWAACVMYFGTLAPDAVGNSLPTQIIVSLLIVGGPSLAALFLLLFLGFILRRLRTNTLPYIRPAWRFLIFPATILFVVSPLVVIAGFLSAVVVDMSAFGGPWGVPFVLLFWSTPIYLAVVAVVSGMGRQYRRVTFAIVAIVAWLIAAVLSVVSALGCLGGHCGQQPLAVEIVEAVAYIAYLVFLCWLAHRPNESSVPQSSEHAL
jgi:hypothetical protein